jgi:hypothetical protein
MGRNYLPELNAAGARGVRIPLQEKEAAMSSAGAIRAEIEIERTATTGHLLIHPNVRKLAADLLNQQLWCWGQDIQHPDGNILLKHGFMRVRSPEDHQGSSAYTLRLADEHTMMMWGFGLFCGQKDQGGVFIKRFGFAPKYTRSAELMMPIWSTAQLPEMRTPSSPFERAASRDLLVCALNWISRYERWVIDTFGIDYRRQCVKAWDKAVVPAECAAGEWLRIASFIEKANPYAFDGDSHMTPAIQYESR